MRLREERVVDGRRWLGWPRAGSLRGGRGVALGGWGMPRVRLGVMTVRSDES